MMAGVRYKNLHKIPLLLTKNVVLLKSSVNQILHLEESCILYFIIRILHHYFK